MILVSIIVTLAYIASTILIFLNFKRGREFSKLLLEFGIATLVYVFAGLLILGAR